MLNLVVRRETARLKKLKYFLCSAKGFGSCPSPIDAVYNNGVLPNSFLKKYNSM
jgi:hypothetical protein